ncbi:hypothetical protein HDG42_007555 [Paraburkholderia sp. JPY171]|nr:hypothetical protein [Paraburkholderia atlantica]
MAYSTSPPPCCPAHLARISGANKVSTISYHRRLSYYDLVKSPKVGIHAGRAIRAQSSSQICGSVSAGRPGRLRLGLPQIPRFLQPGKPGSPLAMTRHQLRRTTPEYDIAPGVFIRFGEIQQLLECLIVGAARCASQLCAPLNRQPCETENTLVVSLVGGETAKLRVQRRSCCWYEQIASCEFRSTSLQKKIAEMSPIAMTFNVCIA